MNVIDPNLQPVRGLLDHEDRLVSADLRLAELNTAAGGAIGAPVAVPQLATLARLVRRLRIAVSRTVTVADGDEDRELWVHAEPTAEGVSLAIAGWGFRAAWTPDTGDEVMRAFANCAADWVWETDAALRVTFVSDGPVAALGLAADEVVGQPLTRLFALVEDEDGELPLLAAAAQSSRFEGQRATVREVGRVVLLDGEPRRDRFGRFAGYVGVVRVTDAPDAAARPSDDLPPAFSARLDQALRVPLARIVANADSINGQADGPVGQEYAGYAADIAVAGRHLIGLVDDLVDLQFVERDGFSVAREELDLGDIARRAAGLLAVRAGERGVRIDPPAPGAELPATGEFRRALQVMVNLVGNAVRYSPEGGTVWIRIERDGDRAAVIVADHGKGIAADDQDRIFEKFERVDPTEAGGSGLGLYIARLLARAMGGDIVVDSAPGQGARFVFTLPARHRDAPAG